MRDLEKDVSIPLDSQEHEMLEMQKEISFISFYWADVVSQLDERIKELDLSFDMWFAEVKCEAISKEKDLFIDEKARSQFIKGLSVSSVKDLVIKYFGEDYKARKKEIIGIERARDKYKGAMSAIEKKHFQLSSIAKNFKREFDSTEK